ncbi:MAG: hypothetical protein RI562_07215, partial [Salibacter sp.]|uniref:hypothetical protein n=1 Tax=Salibacter sp. TaxID=2010995 RepID=UPI00286FEF85
MPKLKLLFSLLFVLNSSFAYSQTLPPNVPSNGLIAWYPFNGNANDESTFNNDGNLFGGVSLTTDRFGNPNSAYDFDGVDDFIEVDPPNEMVFGSNTSYTVNLWIDPDNLPPLNNKQQIFHKYACPYGLGDDIIAMFLIDSLKFNNRGDNGSSHQRLSGNF